MYLNVSTYAREKSFVSREIFGWTKDLGGSSPEPPPQGASSPRPLKNE
jgi:hypothetical protein